MVMAKLGSIVLLDGCQQMLPVAYDSFLPVWRQFFVILLWVRHIVSLEEFPLSCDLLWNFALAYEHLLEGLIAPLVDLGGDGC